MKKCIACLLVLVMVIALPACTNNAEPTTAATTESTAAPTETVAATAPQTVATEPTTAPTTAATTAPTTAPAVAPTEIPTETPTAAPTEIPTETPTAAPTEIPTEDTTPHSEFYVPGVSADQMIAYFNEVVLNVEYSDGEGDVTVVQKWNIPISYRIEGVPDHQDAQLLGEFCKQLNQVEGFPGIRAATGLEKNVTISFLHDDEFYTQFSHLLNGETADGAVQFWYYIATNNIYTGNIGYRKDAPQEIRASVIPEEIVNLLGISDTTLREDSITYQYGSEVTELSAVDWAIIKLLYNPKIQCGMNATQCEAVIRGLYY